MSVFGWYCCLQWFKDTNLKANHNSCSCNKKGSIGCLQWFKDTNLKANHNCELDDKGNEIVVSNGSKILIWKQITTSLSVHRLLLGCLQWFKDTNLKANHNHLLPREYYFVVVSNGSKILIWKQITTPRHPFRRRLCCLQWFKDTNLKANHNDNTEKQITKKVVSNGSKILIWKQITTPFLR